MNRLAKNNITQTVAPLINSRALSKLGIIFSQTCPRPYKTPRTLQGSYIKAQIRSLKLDAADTDF